MTYRVALQSASARIRVVSVDANTERQACNRALRVANRDEPAAGYRVIDNGVSNVPRASAIR